jgi:hypothetical protein
MCGEFVGEPCNVEIRDEIAHLSWPDGSQRHMPLRVFRADCQHANEVLAAYDAYKAPVLRLKRKQRAPVFIEQFRE